MIQINASLRSEVNVDFDMSGNDIAPVLRLYFICSDFFVGFDGDEKKILVPELDHISFPDKIVRAKLEVILDNYNIPIWSEEIEIVQNEKVTEVTENNINRINIKVKLKNQKSIEPKMKIKLK